MSGAQSVDRALALLSTVGRHAGRGVSLSALVDESGLNKPTVRRLLLALIRGGLVEQEEKSRLYFLGEEAYVLGTLASRRFGLLEICRGSLSRLSAKTEDTSFLSVRRDMLSLCLYREEGTYPIRTHALQMGFEHPLGIGAGSLAMLAALRDEDVEEALAVNRDIILERYANLPPDRIRAAVTQTRERGYSLNPGLIVANSWGLGVAFHFPDGRLAGALSIAAIDSRMQEERQTELAGYLRQEATRVEEKLAAMFSARRGAADKSQSRR
ncbi:IclR family transcriptional regulator [Mesorhizobium xinjiangense]|uniref:IclR family transcriptional regulator n=1 Tax=Mesorhizobium xinjiangense TaxID=2678685 RepID=UPI0012EDAB8B|nr:IclR family transcriptional regulator [Mesorhizobium xinjiangense]